MSVSANHHAAAKSHHHDEWTCYPDLYSMNNLHHHHNRDPALAAMAFHWSNHPPHMRDRNPPEQTDTIVMKKLMILIRRGDSCHDCRERARHTAASAGVDDLSLDRRLCDGRPSCLWNRP